jgi:hypothetical protein
MTKPYEATIEGHERQVTGFDEQGNLVLADGARYKFVPVKTPVFDFTNPNHKLISVESLVLENGAWVVGGKSLRDCKNTALYSFLNGQCSPFPEFAENVSGIGIHNPAHFRPVTGEFLPGGGYWTDLRLAVCAVAWFAGVKDPLLLRTFRENVSGTQPQVKLAEPLQPPEITDALLWQVQQRILDKLDIEFRSAPVASQVFVCFCRDRLTLAEMHRRNRNWSASTIKLRIKSLRAFLKKEFHGLKLENFFVDRSIFSAAEKQLADYRAKKTSPLAVGELHNEDGERD